MNPNTRVVICCYEGDAHQMHPPLYNHHECPVLVLSPEDSRAETTWAPFRFGGKRAYTGQDSLDRQVRHLQIMLEYPEEFFLIHDSDSVCLDAELPAYLYEQPNVVWSNQVFDDIPDHQGFFGDWPHVAFQPPYFLSRKTIERILAVADDPRCKASPMMPFIDFFMVQLTMVAGLEWKRFPECISFGICADPRKKLERAVAETYKANTALALNAVRHEGVSIIHSVKDPHVAEALYVARRQFLGDLDAKPRLFEASHVGPGQVHPLYTRRRSGGGPGLKA